MADVDQLYARLSRLRLERSEAQRQIESGQERREKIDQMIQDVRAQLCREVSGDGQANPAGQ